MATAVAPEQSNGVVDPRFGDTTFLDTENKIFKLHKQGWKREEKRHYGGDAVLDELKQFDGESAESFAERKKEAEYNNFGLAHIRAITGELSRHRPTLEKGLSFGGLGQVRPRGQQDGRPSFAELVKYNVDGVGADGSEFEAWMDAVDERAQVTGHRWLMVESSAGNAAGGSLPLADVLAGNRPYAVEFSPLDVPNWYILRGQLQFAVIRVPTSEPRIENGAFVDGTEKGYYLVVRKGYEGLGKAFSVGGWFLFDSERKFVRDGRWSWTEGDIPMWIHYGQRSRGTTELPALSKSSTMELGQISVGLMNAVSARDYDFWDACASRLYFLGAEPETMIQVALQHAKRSIQVGVPFPENKNTGDLKPITIHDGSTGAIAAQVSESIVKAKFESAREQSHQQITSAPDSSGESKKAGHAENKAPILAMRARERQQSEQTLIHYFEKRFGIAQPSGFSQWPTDFNLEPLVDAIDAAFDMLRRSKLRSRTAEVAMAMASLADRGILNDKNTTKIQTELEASYDNAEKDQEAARKALGGGNPIET
jgi:hypothetical protein